MPHIHDRIDFTVEAYIVYENTVLLRKHDKYGLWLGVGGHIELDEDPNEAAIREVREEVGLDVELITDQAPYEDGSYRELIPPRFMNRHPITQTHEHVSLIYFARSETNELVLSEDEKSEECRWFTAEELDDPTIKERIRHYAKSALQAIAQR
jgi:8-oxo-dGTP pyrophosphatase MutT (NUDIX family)